MLEKYLILNAGSSSLKFSLYNSSDETLIGSGNTNFMKVITVPSKDKYISRKEDWKWKIKFLLSIWEEQI